MSESEEGRKIEEKVTKSTKEIHHPTAKRILDKLVEVRKPSRDLSIYRVPCKLREVKADAYNPRLVSIGPFHRGNTDLAPMVEHKWRYLLEFIERPGGYEGACKCLERCSVSLSDDELNNKKIRRFYAEKIDDDDNKSNNNNIDDDTTTTTTTTNTNTTTTTTTTNNTNTINTTITTTNNNNNSNTNSNTTTTKNNNNNNNDIDNKLTELFMLDGCFILELFLRHEERCLNMKLKGNRDPIFNSAWMMAALRQDLALLENQIPFVVLKKLYHVIKPHISNFTPPDSVTSLALRFFQLTNHEALMTREDRDSEDCKHLLDLLHDFYLIPSWKANPNGGDHGHVSINPINLTIQSAPLQNQNLSSVQTTSHLLPMLDTTNPATSETSMKNLGFSRGASQLLESGVQIQKGSPEVDHLLHITFDSDNGVIKIPPITINQRTDSLFRNFIAFEQCHHLKGSHQFTSYVILLKSLIRSKADIQLLRDRDIINQIWPDERHLIELGTILDHLHPKDFCYDKLCKDVNDYRKS